MSSIRKWSLGVYGLITNEKGEVLLIHRRDNDIWQSPGGGVSPDEAPTTAVIREVLEETGYEVRVDRLFGIYFAVERSDIVLTYICTIVGGKPRINEEADIISFFDPHHLPDCTPATKLRIRDFLIDPGALSWTERL